MAISLNPDRSVVRPDGRVKLDVRGLDKAKNYVVIFRSDDLGDFRPPANRPFVAFADPAGAAVTAIEGSGPTVSVNWEATGLVGTSVPVETLVYEQPAGWSFTPNDVQRLLLNPPPGGPRRRSIEVSEGGDDVQVRLGRAGADASPLQVLQTAIRTSTEAISWANYARFMDAVLCGLPETDEEAARIREARDRVKP